MILVDIGLQCRNIVFDAKQYATGIIKMDFDIFKDSLFLPVIGREVHCLLWGAGTFDRHRRLGEDCLAGFQLPDQLPGVGGIFRVIVRCDPVFSKSLLQARDAFPVQFQAGADDQALIGDVAVVGQYHDIIFRNKAADRFLDPGGGRGDQIIHIPACLFRLKDTAADHREAGLIVVIVSRINQCNLQSGLSLEQRAGNGNAGSTGTDYDDVIGGYRSTANGFVTELGQLRSETELELAEIKTMLVGQSNNVFDLCPLFDLHQAPQGNRAQAGAAVTMHRLGAGLPGLLKVLHISGIDGVMHDWQKHQLHAQLTGMLFYLMETLLIFCLPVRTVADQGAGARLIQRVQVGTGDLPGNGKVVCDAFDVHAINLAQCCYLNAFTGILRYTMSLSSGGGR